MNILNRFEADPFMIPYGGDQGGSTSGGAAVADGGEVSTSGNPSGSEKSPSGSETNTGEGGSLLSGDVAGSVGADSEPPKWVKDLGIELDPEIASDQTLAQYQSPSEALKGLVHAQRKIGANTVKVPGANAEQSEWDEFYKAVGRPDSPDEYEMPSEGLPEGEIADEDRKELFSISHELGLDKQRAAKLMRKFAEVKAKGVEHQQAQREQQLESAKSQLQEEFGDAFDEQIDLAKRGIEHFVDEGDRSAFEDPSIGNNPAVVKAFAKVGKMLAQDEVVGGGQSRGFKMTPHEAKRQIEDMNGDPDTIAAITNEAHPKHRTVMQRRNQLYKIAFPGPVE